MMSRRKCYGKDLLGLSQDDLPGKLIVLEGTDGVGRSTQVALLREWLESGGYAVASTGLKRSALAGKGLDKAQQGHTLGITTSNLFYATDFADRLEKTIVPALRAGFVVLTDRYIYSMIARAVVRGVDARWIRDVFGFALIPDAVFYLTIDLPHLIPRLLNDRGFDFWESGMDFLRHQDYYESYIDYQSQLLSQFDSMSKEFSFYRVDANQKIPKVFNAIKNEITDLVKDMKRMEFGSASSSELDVISDEG
jgi:dTMP kinase